jgi:hypothetical protein
LKKIEWSLGEFILGVDIFYPCGDGVGRDGVKNFESASGIERFEVLKIENEGGTS